MRGVAIRGAACGAVILGAATCGLGAATCGAAMRGAMCGVAMRGAAGADIRGATCGAAGLAAGPEAGFPPVGVLQLLPAYQRPAPLPAAACLFVLSFFPPPGRAPSFNRLNGGGFVNRRFHRGDVIGDERFLIDLNETPVTDLRCWRYLTAGDRSIPRLDRNRQAIPV